jgi:D-lyxose ketol-isomerase
MLIFLYFSITIVLKGNHLYNYKYGNINFISGIMKRSEINKIMEDGLYFIEKDMKFLLPPFAKWSVKDWRQKGEESKEIVEQQLGWDITDFGSGNFMQTGLLLFTIRNGSFGELKKPNGKIYAEKAMIVLEEQITPIHFHYQKMEDIINRGGGDLIIQLWNSHPNEELDTLNDVLVSVDGVKVKVNAGGTITLTPGESVCLPQGNYHKFWGKKGKGKVFVGEVSRVNDDYVDNHFYEKVGRFADIEEDVEPLYLLYGDYKYYYKS